VNEWQVSGKIAGVSETTGPTTAPATAPTDAAYVRPVTSVDTLKALADPVRLAILTALMTAEAGLRVMSVKELAAELGEPQTKLYRHVRQLEAAGLIRVASTRMVSGIVEQRYQACQASLAFGPEILRDPARAGEGAAVVTAFLNRYLERHLARQAAGASDENGGDSTDVMLMTSAAVSPATASVIRGKLREIRDLLEQEPEGGTVAVEVILGLVSS
jgi:DNA-binding transcriptional ArsR family regulator